MMGSQKISFLFLVPRNKKQDNLEPLYTNPLMVGTAYPVFSGKQSVNRMEITSPDKNRDHNDA